MILIPGLRPQLVLGKESAQSIKQKLLGRYQSTSQLQQYAGQNLAEMMTERQLNSNDLSMRQSKPNMVVAGGSQPTNLDTSQVAQQLTGGKASGPSTAKKSRLIINANQQYKSKRSVSVQNQTARKVEQGKPAEEKLATKPAATNQTQQEEYINPQDFINLIKCEPDMVDEFCYLNRKSHPYDWEIVPFHKKNPNDFMTISSRVSVFLDHASRLLPRVFSPPLALANRPWLCFRWVWRLDGRVFVELSLYFPFYETDAACACSKT